jgi:RNA polymerase sigma-70 factor (ECF subfamily)
MSGKDTFDHDFPGPGADAALPAGAFAVTRASDDAESPDLQRILRQHAPMCRRIAFAHEANVEAARDLAQDILVAVWRAWPAYRGQCSERTYVARIAQYRVATHVSRAVREPRRGPLTDDIRAADPTPEDDAIRGDAFAQLTKRVRALPLAQREVAILLLEGFTTAEIADTLGITVNAVAIRATRARDALRAMLGAADE